MSSCVSVRFIVVILSTCASALMYALRYNLSIAIIAMVNQTSDATSRPSEGVTAINLGDESCPWIEDLPANATEAQKENGEFNWDPSTQGIILGAYFFGYSLTQIAGGVLAERWSAKWSLGLGVFVSSIGTLMTPWSARMGFYSLWIVRFLIGSFHGLIYSASYTLLGVWIPQDEKAAAIAMIMAGGNLGATVAYPVVGFICDAFGWSLSFYVLGLVGVVWFVLWTWFVTDEPAYHRFISDQELQVISNGSQKATGPRAKVRWLKVVTSTRVWASIVAKVTGSFGFYVLGTMLPSYLAYALHINIRKNGLFNAAVSLVVAFTLIIAGYLADWCRKKNCISLTMLRKVFQTISMVGPCIAFALVPFAGCDIPLIVGLIISTMAIYGLISGGELTIITDFAPEVSGSIFGICNMFASFTGILAPMICGWIVEENISRRQQWDMVFYLCSILMGTGCVFFGIFADATVDSNLVVKPRS